MRKHSKVFVVFVLILTMIMVLTGCTKKDDEEKSSRRERRNRTEKEEDKNVDENDDEEASIFGQKKDEGSSAPMTTAAPAEPATDIPTTAAEDAPTPTEEITPAPTEEITPAPAVPDKYLAEFDTLDDLKFIRSEILGKKLSDVLNTLEKKYNIAVIKDSAIYSTNEEFYSVFYKIDNPGIKVLGNGGFTTLYISYRASKEDMHDGFVRDFEICLTGSEEKSASVIPELAEKTYSSLYEIFSPAFGESDYYYDSKEDSYGSGDYRFYLWKTAKYGNVWLCGGTDIWGSEGYNDCLLSFGIDESEIPAEDTENPDVEEYFKINKKTGFLWMDTSIWNVSYKVFTKLMGDAEITELQDWPHWGTGLQAAFLTDGKYEYACLFQKDKLVQVYMDLDEDMSSKVYDAAVKKYGNPYNAYMYWSGYPAYEWTVTNGTYQQHMEVYDEKNHYRQMYVSPDYSE